MDVWHWTPLVALLCYAGLRAIPPAYYQAAAIDGASRWAVFRYIELPQDARRAADRRAAALHGQLHDLHRAVRRHRRRARQRHHLPLDPPRQDRGRPVRPRAGGGDLDRLLPDHPDAELRLLQRDDPRRHGRPRHEPRAPRPAGLLRLPAAADLLAGQHVAEDQRGDPGRPHAGPGGTDARQLRAHLHRPGLVLGLHQLADLRRDQRRARASAWRCRRPTPSRATASSATSTCSSGC